MRKFILHAFLCCIIALLLIISVLRRRYNGIKPVKIWYYRGAYRFKIPDFAFYFVQIGG